MNARSRSRGRPGRKLAAAVIIFGATTLWAVALAPPASAVITEGTCTGSATWMSLPLTLNAADAIDVETEIPTGDDIMVSWEGDTHLAPSDKEYNFAGSVDLLTAALTFAVADWGGDTKDVMDSGVYSYSIPSWVPKGTGAIPLEAFHRHGDLICRAELRVKLDGSPVNPFSIGSLVLTGIAGTGFVLSGVAKP